MAAAEAGAACVRKACRRCRRVSGGRGCCSCCCWLLRADWLPAAVAARSEGSALHSGRKLLHPAARPCCATKTGAARCILMTRQRAVAMRSVSSRAAGHNQGRGPLAEGQGQRAGAKMNQQDERNECGRPRSRLDGAFCDCRACRQPVTRCRHAPWNDMGEPSLGPGHPGTPSWRSVTLGSGTPRCPFNRQIDRWV